MINLLPPKEKEKLLGEKIYKILLALGILIILFLISLFLILFAIRVHIFSRAESQKIITESAQVEFQVAGLKSLKKDIISINRNLLKVNSFYEKQPNFTELLIKISEIIPNEIYLTDFSLSPIFEEEYRFQVIIIGRSLTREVLHTFKKDIKEKPIFQETYIPLSDLIKLKDIDFKMTFKVKMLKYD